MSGNPGQTLGNPGQISAKFQEILVIFQAIPAPLSDIFFMIHMIFHDIFGFDTTITQYLQYFRSANMVKNCVFLLQKSALRRLATIGKKMCRLYFFFWKLMGGIFQLFVPLSSRNSFTNSHFLCMRKDFQCVCLLDIYRVICQKKCDNDILKNIR